MYPHNLIYNMSDDTYSFNETELIKINIVIIVILLLILEFSSKYNINKPIITTSFLGLLISIIRLYLFHIQKIGNNKLKILTLNYSSIIYINILSIAYLILLFDPRNYTSKDINLIKYVNQVDSGIKLPIIKLNIADLLVLLLPILLLIVSVKIFRNKNFAFKNRYNVKRFGSVMTIFVAKCLLHVTLLIIWYYFTSNIIFI